MIPFLYCILQRYILDKFGPLINNQTWEEEASVSKLELRSDLLEMACSLNQENCIKKAKALFQKYTNSTGTFQYVKYTRNILLSFVNFTVATP